MQYMLTYSKREQTEAYSELCQASKMKLFVKIVHNFQSLTIFAKAPYWKFDKVLNTPLFSKSKKQTNQPR